MDRRKKMMLLGGGGHYFVRSIIPTIEATELIANQTFDSDDGWWTKGGNWTISGGSANHTASAGVDALSRGALLTVGGWYRYEWQVVARTNGGVWVGVGQPTDLIRSALGTYLDIARTTSTTLVWYGNTTFAGSIDNLSCKKLTLTTLLANPRYISTGNMNVSAKVYCVSGTEIGIALNVDSVTNPQNFVLCYINGTKIYLDKYVAGTLSNVTSAAIAYVDNAKIQVLKSGSTYKIYYNNAQIGADQTISDAGIVSNIIAMQFSSYENNIFSSFLARPN